MISLIFSSYLSLCFLFFLSLMASNFHYSIDLNNHHNIEDHDNHHHHHNQQPFFFPLGSSSSISSSSSSSSSSSISSLSYLPFLINPQDQDQVHVPYNNTYHVDHDYLHLSQPLQGKMIIGNGGSSSSSSAYDQMVPKKETRLKLTIRKKDNQETDQTNLLTHQNPTKLVSDSDKWMMSPKMRLIKKTILNSNKPPNNIDHIISKNHQNCNHNNTDHKFQEDHQNNNEDLKKIPTTTTNNGYNTINENGYGNNNGVVRVCSDCHTTKTPLWRSGPRGPKSLCNACGIRQRKARRAALAAAAAAGDDQEMAVARLQQFPAKKKLQNKKKRSNGGDKHKIKRFKIKEDKEEEEEVVLRDEVSTKSSTTCSNSSNSLSSNKLCFDELTIMLSKSSAYQQVFPQDEKEAAILLMALSYGMVHG